MMTLKNYSHLVFMVLILGYGYHANGQNMAAVIKTQAMELSRAILNKDKLTIARFMHPKMIELAGGKEALLNRMDSASSFAGKFGASVQKILIGHPRQVLQYKKEWQCTLPQNTTLQLPMGTIELETTLVGISVDGGKNWYFLDTTMYGEQQLKSNLPDLSPDLVIPAMKPPKIIPRESKTVQ